MNQITLIRYETDKEPGDNDLGSLKATRVTYQARNKRWQATRYQTVSISSLKREEPALDAWDESYVRHNRVPSRARLVELGLLIPRQ